MCNKPLNYKRGKHHQWNVERDGSAGWEVKSRILRSIDGAQELAMICHKLDLLAKQHHLKVNARTGLHLHLGFPNDLVSLQRLVILMHFFEPALSSIVAPSRVFAFDYNNRSYKTQMTNPYCKPISKILDLDLIMQLTHIDQLKEYYRHVSRGGSLNIKPLLTMRTVEFRLHSGTLDSTKVLLWLSVCQQLVHAALFPNDEVKKLMKRRVVTRHYMLPQFNLSELAKTYLPDGHNQSFIHAIKHREAQIRKYWINNLHLRPILDRLMA